MLDGRAAEGGGGASGGRKRGVVVGVVVGEGGLDDHSVEIGGRERSG